MRHEEVRDLRLALIETRDLVWPPHTWLELDNYLAKLRVRLQTLGLERSSTDSIRIAARACIQDRHTAGSVGLSEDPDLDLDEDDILIGSKELAVLDAALQELDERLSARRTFRIRSERSR